MDRFLLLSGVALLGAALSACDNKPAENKPVATVGEPTALTKPAAVAGAKYRIGAAESKIEFVGAKITGKHDGSFGAFSGTVTLPGADPTAGSVSVQIDTSSLQSDNETLTGHLKSADFFDVAKYPRARFESTSVRAGGEKGASHTVSGNLELHGVTKGISFPATIRVVSNTVEVDAEFAINRKDFGLVYPGKPDDLIKDEVLIKLKVRAPKGE